MKKTFQTLAVVILLALPCVSLASIDRNLSYGAKGEDVTELQDFLIDQGFLRGSPTGNYYTLTRSAVMKWQKSVGLPSSGYFGKLSREEFNAIADSATEATDEEQDNTVSVDPNLTSDYQKTMEANRKLSEEMQARLNQQSQLDSLNQSIKNLTQVISPTPTPLPIPTPVPTPDQQEQFEKLKSYQEATITQLSKIDMDINTENYSVASTHSEYLYEPISLALDYGITQETKDYLIKRITDTKQKLNGIASGIQTTGTTALWINVSEYFTRIQVNLDKALVQAKR